MADLGVGDRLGDIVFGAGAARSDGLGAAYVIFGKKTTTTVSAANPGSGGFVINGATPNAIAGFSAAIVGDPTRDGLADVLVGAPGVAATSGGAAYLVAGGPETSPVALAPGERVTRLTAPSEQRFGADVTAIGDTDNDNGDDLAIGSPAGVHVVRRIPADGTVDQTDGFRVIGPANAPANGVPAVTVASPGDTDQDGRNDLLVGYPDASGRGRAYVINSPEGFRTLDVNTLPGQRGTAVSVGAQSHRSAAGLAADGPRRASAGDPLGAAVALGAPAAEVGLTVDAGAVYVSSAASAASSSAGARARAAASASGCYGFGLPPANPTATPPVPPPYTVPYRFEVGPDAAFGYPGASLTNGRARFRGTTARLPTCRLTRAGKRDRVFKAKTPRRVERKKLRLSTFDIVDSRRAPYARVTQTETTIRQKRAFKWKVTRLSDGDTLIDLPQSRVGVSVQSYGCIVTGGQFNTGDEVRRERKNWVFVRINPRTDKRTPATDDYPLNSSRRIGRNAKKEGLGNGFDGGEGVSGFMPRAAAFDAIPQLADFGCGRSYLPRSAGALRSGAGSSSGTHEPNPPVFPAIGSQAYGKPDPEPGDADAERFQGSTTAQKSCPDDYTRPNCGVAYQSSYQPQFFGDVLILADTTTGVSGRTGDDDEDQNRSGGVVFAVVRTTAPFDQTDEIGYEDPNVPCGRRPVVRWKYGNFNPAGFVGLYGWTPEVRRDSPQPVRSCPPEDDP